MLSEPNEQSIDSQSRGEAESRITRPWLLVPLILALVAAVILRVGNISPSIQDSPAIGKPAPQLDLVRLSEDWTLGPVRSVQSGKVTLLHCWGTWCGPCRMEYPELSAMSRVLSSDPRFVFMSVSCEMGAGETFEGLRQKTRDYLRSEGISDEVFADPTGITRQSLAERMERRSLFYPTSVLIDGEGRIAAVWEGYSPDSVSEMRTLASQLIASCKQSL